MAGGTTQGHEARRTQGYALYAGSISVWMAFVSCCSMTYALPLLPEGAGDGLFVVFQQVAYVASFFLAAVLEARVRHVCLRALWAVQAVALAIAVACAALLLGGISPAPICTFFGGGLGVGVTCGYLQWIRIISARPEREVVELLLIGSVASIASGVLFTLAPTGARLAALCALAPLSVALAWANHGTLDEAGSATVREAPAGTGPDSPIREDDNPGAGASLRRKGRQEIRTALRRLALPAACAAVLVLVVPIAGTAYVDTGDQDVARAMLAQVANALTVAIFAYLCLRRGRSFGMVEAYRVLLPVLATAVLASAFFPAGERWFVLFFGDVCFCASSLLLLLDSCRIARETDVPTTFVYGVFAGVVYLARTPEMLLSFFPVPIVSSGASFVVAVLLLYLLTVPAMFQLLGRGREARSADAEERGASADLCEDTPRPVTDISDACCDLAREARLPERQTDVLILLAQGNSVARISELLTLSDNTVRSYRKNIYAVLDVHSHQELLDCVRDAQDRAGANDR